MRRRREPDRADCNGPARRFHLVLEAVCVVATAACAFLAVADGVSFWLAAPILLVLAGELLVIAAGPVVRRRSAYWQRQLERSEERLLSAEASLWLGDRGGSR